MCSSGHIHVHVHIYVALELAIRCSDTPKVHHPEGNLGPNLKSIAHRCHPILVAFLWKLTEETIKLPLGCV